MADSEDYKASQSKHAQEIRATRSVMDAMGVSREQARAVMNNFRAELRQAGTRRAEGETVPQKAVERRDPPKIEVETQAFEPRPLTLATSAVAPAGDAGSSSSSSGTPVPEVIIVANGSAYTATILCSGNPELLP